jgi:hypothetical protein
MLASSMYNGIDIHAAVQKHSSHIFSAMPARIPEHPLLHDSKFGC